MSAVWAASRAGVRRRGVQTVSVAVVVALSTATLVFGLGLLSASTSLFDDAFEKARGAHASVSFDASKVSAAQAAATAKASGVTAAAGPFQTATLARTRGPIEGDGGLLVAGRASPGGPVDRLTITSGRWAEKAGEIVLRGNPMGPLRLGSSVSADLTVVGFATSATDSGPGGWVTPEQIGSLRPDGLMMEYRFARAGDASQVRESVSAATGGLPTRGFESYLTFRQEFEKEFRQLIPFVTVFGALAMAVSVFLIANVVGGAVISGYRRIGVMKAIGFTPAQVTTVFVMAVLAPAVLGCAVGLVAGHLLAGKMAADLASGFDLPSTGGADPVLDVAAGAGVLALVVLVSVLPALRAGRLPAVQAISAGTVSRRGRGRRAQRWLARTRLPASLGLGLSLPVARPARAALTLAGLCLGVAAVTMGTGLQQTVLGILTADTEGHTSVQVGPDPRSGPSGVSEQEIFAAVRAQPGTAHMMSSGNTVVTVPGSPSKLHAETYRGDYRAFLGDNLVRGRWFSRPGEIVPSEAFMRLNHLDVGDDLTLRVDEKQVTVRIVGAFSHDDAKRLMLDAASLPATGDEVRPVSVIVKPGTDPAAYAARINAGGGLYAEVSESDLGGSAIFSGLFLLFSLIICTTAALGVLNSVVLSARERARDLGVLKAIGMSPRQVVLMMVTSMAALGAAAGAAGVPLGVLAHHGVVELTGELLGSGMAASWIHVYSWSLLAPLACAGPVVAVLGAWPPAGRAAATRTAAVLRSE
ncbi:ABC transporter permease [Actinomadura madurae]|uniref:ABC transporter permease n=1 Tax=Actinomadura madurae TaxID=1993 RepID=UPI000D9F6E06|nr:ABC transporter permease [Actinomadura madurae]SPT50295.1 outer membrane-specific lipoprotein transporter subunit LolC [Actinomadura madurae]